MRVGKILAVLAIAVTAGVVVPAGAAQADAYGAYVQVTNEDGRKEGFQTNDVDNVWHEWASTPGGPVNSGWWILSGQKISSGLGATHNEDGRLEIFGRGPDQHLWHNWQQWPGGDWSGWYPIHGLIKAHTYVGAWYDEGTKTIRVQVVGTDGSLHVLRQLHQNCCWSDVWE